MDLMGYVIMRLLLTGASGYLGREISGQFNLLNKKIIKLSNKGQDTDYNCDLTDKKKSKYILNQIKPEKIIHCASFVPKNSHSYSNIKLLSKNVQILKNLLNYTKCPIINISSMSVYSGKTDKPLKEDDKYEPISFYGKCKLKCEELIEHSNRPGLSIRVPGLFGFPRKSGLVYNLLYSKKYNLPYKLPTIPLIWAAMHVSDAARSIIKLSNFTLDYSEKVNIGYDEKFSVNSFLRTLEETFNYNFNYKLNHPLFQLDLTKSKLYGANPKVNFKEVLINFHNQI